MAIRRGSVTLTAAADGTASGKIRTVDGVIHAVHLNYSASFDATNVVTLAEAGNSPALPILTVTNVAADAWFYPRITLHDIVGAAIVGPVDYQSISDEISVTLSGAAENDVVIVTVVWDDMRR